VLTSPAFVDMAVIDSSNHMLVMIDPDGRKGAPEVVKVTAHTVASDTVTAERGFIGVARAHAAGTDWVHGPVASDMKTARNTTWYRNSEAHPLDDEFDDGVLDSAWTRVDRVGNSTPLVWTEANDVLSLKHEGSDNGNEFHALVKPLGGLTFPLTIETAHR
jgi:hypothetical protein